MYIEQGLSGCRLVIVIVDRRQTVHCRGQRCHGQSRRLVSLTGKRTCGHGDRLENHLPIIYLVDSAGVYP